MGSSTLEIVALLQQKGEVKKESLYLLIKIIIFYIISERVVKYVSSNHSIYAYVTIIVYLMVCLNATHRQRKMLCNVSVRKNINRVDK